MYYHRHSIRLDNFDYSKNGYYFVTICCQNRINYFCDVGAGLVPAQMIKNGISQMILNDIGKFVNKIILNYFNKKDGSSMVLPHYYARYESGEVNLNEEYSDYKWVEVAKLAEFEPKIETVEMMVKNLLRLVDLIKEEELLLI